MKAITALFLILLTACVGSSVYAHPSAVPLVELKVSLTDDALTYRARIPTFAIGPLAGYDLAEGESLPTSTDEVEAFFAKTCPVKIDGIAVRPVLSDILICAPELLSSSRYDEGFGQADPYVQGDAAARPEPPSRWMEAKMTLVYNTKGAPRRVSMVWNVFTADGAEELGLLNPYGTAAFGGNAGQDADLAAGSPNEVIALSDLMGRRSFLTFTPYEPESVWHSDARASRAHLMAVVPAAAQKTIQLPLVSIAATVLLILFLAARSRNMPRGSVALTTLIVLVVGIGARDVGRVEVKQFWLSGVEVPAETEAKEIFVALHRNVYRAFDYDTEDAIYDTLAQSVSGELLDEVYNEVYQSLVLQDQGGAICKIEKVEILESKMMASNSEAGKGSAKFRVSCRWKVKGLVEHWGHAHRRVNRYGAVYTLRPFGDSWRIYDVEINEQERILGNAGR
ncbi:MAG: hypothetical protein QF473_03180 [Planctomycetota bacterium]|nr:hypothetical protein [Planctomycetota bacterium]